MWLDKQAVIDMHAQEFEAWAEMLSSWSAEQLTAPVLHDGLSIRDVVAHLAAWQQRTVARLEGALRDHAPRFPEWPVELEEVETVDSVDRANAWILETHRDWPWADVYEMWRTGYLRFLELLREIPDEDVRPGGKLAWVAEYQPLDEHSDEFDYHHAEHRVELDAWFRGVSNS